MYTSFMEVHVENNILNIHLKDYDFQLNGFLLLCTRIKNV